MKKSVDQLKIGVMNKVLVRNHVHFLNSLFITPRVYSCAVDCFLELSRYLFLPFLSQLSSRTEFFELLYCTLMQYVNSTHNDLPQIREPIWVYFTIHCSSFRGFVPETTMLVLPKYLKSVHLGK